MFETSIYVERRARLKRALSDRSCTGLALITGNLESPMNYAENFYHFRQDSSFLYYWGLDGAGLDGVIDLDSGEEILFGHDPGVDEIVWTGVQPSLAERAARVGISTCRPRAALPELLGSTVTAGRDLHVLPQYRGSNILRIAAATGWEPDRVRSGTSPALAESIVEQRSVKSPEEIVELELAAEVAYHMHTGAMRFIEPGRVEREIAGAIEGIAVARGRGLSFPAILSVRSEVLHNHSYDNVIGEGQMVVCDAGASSPLMYASDITRTMPSDGRFTDRQRDIYEVVLDAQVAAVAAVRPGVPFRDIHLLASRIIAEGLIEIGVMKGDPAEAVAVGAHALFFVHGLGHMMGLDVHDMEQYGEDLVGYDETVQRSDQFGLAYLRLARPLQPGFVMTVEPGVYFIPELIERWRSERMHEAFIDYDRVTQYVGFGGVRIEDDVVVTDTGYHVLGPPIPKTVSDVEAEMAGQA